MNPQTKRQFHSPFNEASRLFSGKPYKSFGQNLLLTASPASPGQPQIPVTSSLVTCGAFRHPSLVKPYPTSSSAFLHKNREIQPNHQKSNGTFQGKNTRVSPKAKIPWKQPILLCSRLCGFQSRTVPPKHLRAFPKHTAEIAEKMVSENGRQTSIYGHVNGKNDDITSGWNGIASFPFFSGKSCFSDK